jgi:3-hydroxyanthranilate 3,4-dioxygenase
VEHRPERPANTVGLVIECKRPEQEVLDGLIWYCDNCNNELHKYKFHLDNIEKDFIPRFKEFYASEKFRTCSKCGTVMEADPRFV